MITLTLHDEDAKQLLLVLYDQPEGAFGLAREIAIQRATAGLRCALNLCDCGREPRSS